MQCSIWWTRNHGTAVDPAATPEPTEVCRTTDRTLQRFCYAHLTASPANDIFMVQFSLCSGQLLCDLSLRSDLVELVNRKLKLNRDAGSAADGGAGRFKMR